MAQQLKKKFIADNAVDGDKIKLLKDQSLEIENQAGQVISLLQLNASDEVLIKGEAAATRAYVDQEVNAEETRALAAEGVLQGEINAEEIARIAADSALQDAVDDEVTARIAADDVLDTAISAEQTRAVAEEARIEGKVDQEVIDRAAADTALQSNIDAEETRALAQEAAIRSEFAAADTALHTTISAEIDADVLVEKNRAEGEESRIESKIDQEISDRGSADTALQAAIDAEKGRIDAILSASTADADSFKEIVDLINSIDTENDEAFSAYVLSNNAALAAEVSARETLEGEFDAYVISNNAALAQEVTDRAADVDAEETRALAAEGVLQGNIDSEALARAAEDLLMLKLDGSRPMEAALAMGSFKISGMADGVADSDAINKGQLDAAIAGAASDVTALESSLNQEISDREAGDDALRGVLGGMEAYTTIKALSDAVEAEESARGTLEGEFDAYVISNDAALSAEVSARSTLEGEYDAYVISNDAALAAEVSARETLEGEYDAYVISNNAALAQEVSDRSSADNTLQSNIDAEESARITADGVLQDAIDVEKGRIDAILDMSTADADSFKEIVDLINSVDTENDNLFSGHVTTYNAYVAANDARVLAVEGEVDTLQSEMVAVEGRLDVVEPKVSTLELEMDAVENRATTLEGEMDSAEGRLDAIEAEVFHKEQFVLTQTEVDAQKVVLSNAPEANSVVAFAGRLALHEGATQDYEMSGADFQFRGDIATGGVSALVVGDVITVVYYK